MRLACGNYRGGDHKDEMMPDPDLATAQPTASVERPAPATPSTRTRTTRAARNVRTRARARKTPGRTPPPHPRRSAACACAAVKTDVLQEPEDKVDGLDHHLQQRSAAQWGRKQNSTLRQNPAKRPEAHKSGSGAAGERDDDDTRQVGLPRCGKLPNATPSQRGRKQLPNSSAPAAWAMTAAHPGGTATAKAGSKRRQQQAGQRRGPATLRECAVQTWPSVRPQAGTTPAGLTRRSPTQSAGTIGAKLPPHLLHFLSAGRHDAGCCSCRTIRTMLNRWGASKITIPFRPGSCFLEYAFYRRKTPRSH